MKTRKAWARSVAASMLVACLGCETPLRPISDRPTIGGERADQVKLVVPSAFSFLHGLETFTVPAGRYTAAMEDDLGVYFRAPAEVVSFGPLSPTSVYNGGLYVSSSESQTVFLYLVVRNHLRAFEMPTDFRYSVER